MNKVFTSKKIENYQFIDQFDPILCDYHQNQSIQKTKNQFSQINRYIFPRVKIVQNLTLSWRQ